MLHKDDSEHAVPESLRPTFRQIADSLVAGDYRLMEHPVDGVRPVDADTAKWIAESVSAYGDKLAPLNEETWKRSIYRWMDGHWIALVDLTTVSEPVSDLVLHANLYEGGDVEVYGVYVP
jgi:hypothetical protein